MMLKREVGSDKRRKITGEEGEAPRVNWINWGRGGDLLELEVDSWRWVY